MPETMMVAGEDGRMVEMEIVNTKEKESLFKKSVPIMPMWLAVIFAILNVVPGLGTFLAALSLIFCFKTSFSSNLEGCLIGIGTAFLQFATAFVVVGWFWSLWHGVYFVNKSAMAHQK